MQWLAWKVAAAVLAGVALLGAAIAAAVVGLGLYDLSATDPHLRPTYALLELAMKRSIARRAADLAVPPLEDPDRRALGLRLYHEHCVQCHGAPGIAPEPFALGLLPRPANLAATAREWSAAELYWTVRHGIKMTGMPAWEHRMSDAEIWSVVAFLRMLPQLSPPQYREMTGLAPRPRSGSVEPAEDPGAVALGDPARGLRAIQQYACNTCHVIPGVVGPHVQVGPPLDAIARRRYLAGVVRNTPGQMVRWLRDPQSIAPDSAMPDLGVTDVHARDIAAYLYTLD